MNTNQVLVFLTFFAATFSTEVDVEPNKCQQIIDDIKKFEKLDQINDILTTSFTRKFQGNFRVRQVYFPSLKG